MNNVQRESAAPLLDIENLRISFPTAQGRTEAVRGVSLRMGRERVAVVGESGSGKSVTGFSIMGLVDAPGRIAAGSITLAGEELVGASASRLRAGARAGGLRTMREDGRRKIIAGLTTVGEVASITAGDAD